MSHKSSRAVHRSRDCAGLEHDARVPFSEDLTTAKHGIRRKTPISAPDMTKALKVHARITPGNVPRSPCTPSRIRRGAYTGSSRGGPAYGNATRILEEAEYGLEIPQTHGSTNPRIGRKLDKRERKYGGTQSRNTNKSLINVPTTNCIPSKWVR